MLQPQHTSHSLCVLTLTLFHSPTSSLSVRTCLSYFPHLVLSNLILLNLIPSSLILSYLNPGAMVVARMEVLKIEERRLGLLLTCSTQIRLADGQLAVDGEAKVLLPRCKG